MFAGDFIVFEGGEGTGKTTQIHALKKHLESKGREVVLSWEPGGTPLGEKIRSVLLSPDSGPMSYRCEALLYAAARAQHVEKVIGPALERKAVVLCDRYWDASRAYQGMARGLGMAPIDAINMWATGGLHPDQVFLFDIDPRVGLKRVSQRAGGKLDRLEQEALSFHDKVREAYLFLAKKSPASYTVIDATQSIESISAFIQSKVDERLKSRPSVI